jgi:DNA polymerase IV (archaeal DinB-like DNA polymerase)
MKREIAEKEALTCSIGVGPNKLVAKVASDFHKPDGLTLVREEEAERFLSPLPVRRLLWIGRKTEGKLKTFGINTIGELARYDPTVLTETFGVFGTQMHLMARGIDRSEVETRGEVKSVSHETTFEEDTDDAEMVLRTSDALSEEVAREIQDQNLSFKTVTIKLRYENFETHTSAKTLSFMTNRVQDIKKTARDLLQPFLNRNKKVRLIGVRVSTLVKGDKQKTLV